MAQKKSKTWLWFENEQKQKRYWDNESIHDFLYYALREIDKVCRGNNIHYYLACGSVLGAVRNGGIIPWDPDADVYVPAQEMKRFVDVARKQLPNDLYIDFYDTNPSYIYTFPRIGKKGFSSNGLHLDVFHLVGLPKGKKQNRFLEKYEWQRIWFGVERGHWESAIPRVDRVCDSKLFRRSIRILKLFLNKEKTVREMQKMATEYSIFDKEKCDSVYDGLRTYSAEYFKDGKEVVFNGNKYLIPSNWHEYLKHTYGDYMSYPKDRCFQSIIRNDVVKEDIKYYRVAYVSTFKEINANMINELERLYWECGSIVAIADVSGLEEQQKRNAIAVAKSLKYFDKVLINETDKKEKLLEMIGTDNIVESKI